VVVGKPEGHSDTGPDAERARAVQDSVSG
jgi:hypothetical protein